MQKSSRIPQGSVSTITFIFVTTILILVIATFSFLISRREFIAPKDTAQSFYLAQAGLDRAVFEITACLQKASSLKEADELAAGFLRKSLQKTGQLFKWQEGRPSLFFLPSNQSAGYYQVWIEQIKQNEKKSAPYRFVQEQKNPDGKTVYFIEMKLGARGLSKEGEQTVHNTIIFELELPPFEFTLLAKNINPCSMCHLGVNGSVGQVDNTPLVWSLGEDWTHEKKGNLKGSYIKGKLLTNGSYPLLSQTKLTAQGNVRKGSNQWNFLQNNNGEINHKLIFEKYSQLKNKPPDIFLPDTLPKISSDGFIKKTILSQATANEQQGGGITGKIILYKHTKGEENNSSNWQAVLKNKVAGVVRGNLLLDGETQTLVLNGPVVVKGDVFIKGVTRGQGTIFVEGNIYVVGNLVYESHASSLENWHITLKCPEQLNLAATGNIIVGNPFAHLSSADSREYQRFYRQLQAKIPAKLILTEHHANTAGYNYLKVMSSYVLDKKSYPSEKDAGWFLGYGFNGERPSSKKRKNYPYFGVLPSQWGSKEKENGEDSWITGQGINDFIGYQYYPQDPASPVRYLVKEKTFHWDNSRKIYSGDESVRLSGLSTRRGNLDPIPQQRFLKPGIYPKTPRYVDANCLADQGFFAFSFDAYSSAYKRPLITFNGLVIADQIHLLGAGTGSRNRFNNSDKFPVGGYFYYKQGRKVVPAIEINFDPRMSLHNTGKASFNTGLKVTPHRIK